MKTTAAHFRLPLFTGIFSFAAICIGLAADTNSASSDSVAVQSAAAPAPSVSVAAPAAKLPYGVEDVLKLSRAQIGEDVILNYVQSSGTIYNLSPKEIVYLRDQGVSEKVISTMIDQRKRVEMAAQAAAAPVTTGVATAPEVANAPMAPYAGTVPAAPGYADQSATYAEAPLTPPASTAYVIPYSGASYAYYGPSYYPYPYYCGPAYYGGWYGPSVAIGFGFGGRGGFHGGHGGFHGGGHGSFAGRGGHR